MRSDLLLGLLSDQGAEVVECGIAGIATVQGPLVGSVSLQGVQSGDCEESPQFINREVVETGHWCSFDA